MAAFEAVSSVALQRHGRVSVIDSRIAKLPHIHETSSIPDNYDPKDHRVPVKPIKLWMAYFNIIRSLFGAAVLGLPLAISQCGIVFGPIMSIVMGILAIRTHFKLLWCLNEISRQLRIPHISYRYGFRIALLHGPPCFRPIGEHGPKIIATLMVLSQLGICTVFVIFTSDSLRDIMDWNSSRPALLALIGPYLVLEFFMKSLSIVSYVSLLGNLMNMVGMCVVLYYLFEYPHGEYVAMNTEPLHVFSAFGAFLFNWSAVGVILSIDKAIKDPKALTKPLGVLTVGMFTPCLFGTLFGVLGYWSFGSMEENILRSLPYEEDGTMASIGLYLIAIVLVYPLQSYPAIQIIIEVIKNHNLNHTPSNRTLTMMEYIARPIFVLMTFFMSYLMPFQGPCTAFVGCMCTTLLALVFPALMELCIMYPSRYGKYDWYLYENLIFIFIGTVAWILGIVLCGYLIYVRTLENFAPDVVDYF